VGEEGLKTVVSSRHLLDVTNKHINSASQTIGLRIDSCHNTLLDTRMRDWPVLRQTVCNWTRTDSSALRQDIVLPEIRRQNSPETD